MLPIFVKTWIAENLAQECSETSIKDYLLAKGYLAEAIDTEIHNAKSSPYLPPAIHFARLYKMRDSLLKTLDFFQRFDPQSQKIKKEDVLPYADFIHRYLAHNRPGIFRGAFDHWPARQWTPALLLEKIGAETPVQVQLGRSSDPDYERNNANLRQTISFGEFIERVEGSASNDIYMTANNFTLDKPEFSFMREGIQNIGEQFGEGYLASNPTAKTTFLWIGPAGIVTGMHKDLNHILFCQIYGRKTFRLYPAIQVPYMYSGLTVFGGTDPFNPDDPRYPLFKQAKAIEITVEAGDMLYIPIGWWHHVVGETASISVSVTSFKGFPNHYVDYPFNVFGSSA